MKIKITNRDLFFSYNRDNKSFNSNNTTQSEKGLLVSSFPILIVRNFFNLFELTLLQFYNFFQYTSFHWFLFLYIILFVPTSIIILCIHYHSYFPHAWRFVFIGGNALPLILFLWNETIHSLRIHPVAFWVYDGSLFSWTNSRFFWSLHFFCRQVFLYRIL